MKKLFFLHRLILVFILPILILSCKPKEKEQLVPNFNDGVLIVNEGSFGHSNGTISYFNKTSKNITNDIFALANGRPLGDVVQSLSFINGRGFIVVNNSSKIEVVDATTFKSTTTLSGFDYPRYIQAINNNKAYITEAVDPYGYSSGNIKVIDLNSYSVTKTIGGGLVPDRMLFFNQKLYVTNSADSSVFVINTNTDVTLDTIKLNNNPTGIVKDANDNIWVLCGGKKVYTPPTYALDPSKSTVGSLIKMNASGNVLSTFLFTDNTKYASNLAINSTGDVLYYTYAGKVFELSTSASSLNSVPFISKSFYGFAIDLTNNNIYAGVAKDFTSDDYFYRYSSVGTKLDSFKVGIAPNGFAFN